MSLPMLTTAEDAETVAYFLRAKPNGSTITEAKTVISKALFEPQKMNAYEYWGIIKRDGDNIKLDSIGDDLVNIAPSNKHLVYQKLIRNIEPYFAAVKWMFNSDFSEITNIEIATQWNIHFKSEVGTSDENQQKSMATCFLQICSAAAFGSLGSSVTSQTRPSQMISYAINKANLGHFFTEVVPLIDSAGQKELSVETPLIKEQDSISEPVKRFEPTEDTTAPKQLPENRIFISTCENKDILEQIKTMLETDKYNYALSDEVKSELPISDKVITTMRKCSSAIICVTADEREKLADGKFGIAKNSLVELGAAIAVFNNNVVLLWDSRLDIPPNLKGLNICDFSGNELSWNEGVNLMKALSRFKL